jgi:hypothetical protein
LFSAPRSTVAGSMPDTMAPRPSGDGREPSDTKDLHGDLLAVDELVRALADDVVDDSTLCRSLRCGAPGLQYVAKAPPLSRGRGSRLSRTSRTSKVWGCADGQLRAGEGSAWGRRDHSTGNGRQHTGGQPNRSPGPYLILCGRYCSALHPDVVGDQENRAARPTSLPAVLA